MPKTRRNEILISAVTMLRRDIENDMATCPDAQEFEDKLNELEEFLKEVGEVEKYLAKRSSSRG